MILLKVMFWVVLAVNFYFATAEQINVYYLVLKIWFPNKNESYDQA